MRLLSLVTAGILNSAIQDEKELDCACFMCTYVRVDVRVRAYTPRLCICKPTYTNTDDNLIVDESRFLYHGLIEHIQGMSA